jgi:FkbM family methyltransferase
MNPVVSAIERAASSLNGLGLWRGEQFVWDHRMRSSSFDRSLYLWMHGRGLMGSAERATLSRLVRPGMLVLDVGANLGLYSLLMAGLVGPTGRVVSFEPDPALFSLLKENCAANGAENVECVHLALGSQSGRMTLQRPTLNSGDNHLGNNTSTPFRRPIEVGVASLDSLMPGLRPDFIKVDVQGWELKVLRGMEGTLRASEGVGIFLEICPKWLHRAGETPQDLYRFVRDLGFRFYSCKGWEELDEERYLALSGSMRGEDHVDLLASRKAPQPAACGA